MERKKRASTFTAITMNTMKITATTTIMTMTTATITSMIMTTTITCTIMTMITTTAIIMTMTTATITTKKTPVYTGGMPKEASIELAMELAWVIFPIPKEARKAKVAKLQDP